MDETGHLAALFVTECAEKRATIISLGRQTCPVHITIANPHPVSPGATVHSFRPSDVPRVNLRVSFVQRRAFLFG